MNPNAKEFVPAHILKKRHEEAEAQRISELSEKFDGVNLDKDADQRKTESSSDSRKQVHEKNDSPSDTTLNNESQRLINKGDGCGDETKKDSALENNSSPISQDANHVESSPNHHSSSSDNFHNNHHHINGSRTHHDLEQGYDDRLLLKAGENYCVFNGEEFIVPGDEEEYEGDVSNAGYDFGNAEDNEDEDIANAFEEFLGTLPE